jgi:hypothetical protein
VVEECPEHPSRAILVSNPFLSLFQNEHEHDPRVKTVVGFAVEVDAIVGLQGQERREKEL